ncbi:MAG: hypothetical protein WC346_01095 [Methanogenium sp.]|jgi:hypothetical protein
MVLQFNGKNGFVELEVGKLFTANFGEEDTDTGKWHHNRNYLAIMKDEESEEGYSVFVFKTETEFSCNGVGEYYSPVSALKNLVCTFEPC